MKGLFNRTFYRFTAGFIGILIAAFTLVALVRHFETAEATSGVVERR